MKSLIADSPYLHKNQKKEKGVKEKFKKREKSKVSNGIRTHNP